MAAKSNKKNNLSQSGMTLEEAIEKSRVQVAENADLVTESEAAASAATNASEAKPSEASSKQDDSVATTQEADLSDFVRRGIDISGLKENEKDENLKIQPEAAEPPTVNPYTDSFTEEEEALPEGKTNDQLTAGQFLRYHRIKRKMSIAEVANEIRARSATIADIENDRLCEPTSKDFAESFILRYGKLFDLDQDDLIARFRRHLSQKVTVISDKSNHKKFDLQIARSWFMMVLIILVATAGYFVFSAQEASKKAEQQGVTITPESQVTKDQPAVEIYASNNKSPVAPVVIEDAQSGKGPEVRIVDKNTALATAQQRAMQNNGDGSTKVNPAAAAEAKSPLGLPPGAKQDNAANGTIAVNAANGTIAVNAANGTIAVNAPAQNTNVSVGSAPNVSVNANANTAQMMAQAQDSKDAQKAAADAEKLKAEAEKLKAEAQKDKAPALAQKLTDISKSVRVVNRDGLASLNHAEIEITKPMSLKVLDRSGKVLVSGTYNKGDSVKVTGVPPITVQLTATDAVKISYMGGHITMPAGKQVKFKLPER